VVARRPDAPALIGLGAAFVGFVGVFSALITATYILRMFSFAFFGPFNARWSGLRDLLPTEVLAGSLLAGAIIFLGLWPLSLIHR